MTENLFSRFTSVFTETSFIETIITRSLRVVMIGLIIMLALRFLKTAESALLNLALRKNDEDDDKSKVDRADVTERSKRLSTVLKVLGTTVKVAIVITGGFMALKELGFDITPLLTGAGIAGVAIGFGSQSLVRDVISGVFLLLENQIRIGDAVKIGALSGTVERMELRVTVLRDLDGTIHIIPNGEIKFVSNMTYQWGQAVVDVPLAYQANVDDAIGVLKQVIQGIAGDSMWRGKLSGQPEVVGLSDFEGAMRLRILARTTPADRWAVERELRLRVKKALDAASIPFVGTRAAK